MMMGKFESLLLATSEASAPEWWTEAASVVVLGIGYVLWCHRLGVQNGNSPKNAHIFPIDSPVVADKPLGK